MPISNSAETMPKQPNRDKDFRRRKRTSSQSSNSKPISVKDLLAIAGITTSAIAQHTVKQQSWRELLAGILPEGLAVHIKGCESLHGRLTVLVSSPAWAVRLRYVLNEHIAQIRAHDASVLTIVVKVSTQR